MSRQRVFVTADTHFGHKNIIGFESERRPFASIAEHDEALVERWNAAVKPTDTIWHLGDVLFGRHSFALLPRLNGRKKLVMGNHDQYPTALYLEHFVRVFGAAQLAGCILSHVPVHPSQKYRFAANFHGHTHSKTLSDPWYLCVSVEQNNLAPIPLEKLLSRIPDSAPEARAEGGSTAERPLTTAGATEPCQKQILESK